MAEIYRAKTFDAQGNAHWVAVKRVLGHLAEDEDFIQMLVDEAKIASQIRHPNIARVYEFTQAHAEYFIAMEHVDGKDLRSILERCRETEQILPPDHAAYIAAEVATALHAAHNVLDHSGRPLGIVHRDVSPSNVLCAYSGEVKLCDFGIAKASLSRVQTKTGVIKGKIKYMSPEQALGHKVDHRSDIFSLGACLYEMLTRMPPFAASNEMDLIIRVRDAKYRRINQAVDNIPPELEAICDKCLSKKLGHRYQSAGELAGDLQNFLRRHHRTYSRTQFSRYVRTLFATEIDTELRMLEEYVLGDQVDDDLGENLIAPALGPGAEYSKFSPRPTHMLDLRDARGDFAHDPGLDAAEFDLHAADTLILANGKKQRYEQQQAAENQHKIHDPRATASTHFAGDQQRDPRLASTQPGDGGEQHTGSLHAAPTRILRIDKE
ncbi:serine/threonine protein kinase [Haliangium ochraceum DSM 14365]|uniref:Serine/threonine protein kinase n=2 Tax=Haliangium ochraceum TaxID=80816 RepID=D0LUZ2_HALO1|nr:serine/threonine protein kinase [Haliangium ochraceum DSM 14365]